MSEGSVDTQAAEKYAAQDWNALCLDKDLQGMLNQQLRQQILAQSQNDIALDDKDITQLASRLVDGILNNTHDKVRLEEHLEALYTEQIRIYTEENIPKRLRTRQYISASGLVISPDHCVTTLRDSLRVRGFIRGIDKALQQLTAADDDAKIRIAYPACGPFAPLLLPLIAFYRSTCRYSSEQLQITLIDIQEGAVRALKALVGAYQLDDYIEAIICADATEYQSTRPFDLVVLEAMQHGFSREGHLQIASHFARQLKRDGLFIPQNISVGAMLNVAQREYVEQWDQDASDDELKLLSEQIRAERTDLGEIFSVSVETLRNLDYRVLDEQTQVVECGTVTIPQLSANNNKQTLSIYSELEIFQGEKLAEYESGITHPLPDLQICVNFTPSDPKPGDLLVNSGESLTFYYCINGLPGFLAAKAHDFG